VAIYDDLAAVAQWLERPAFTRRDASSTLAGGICGSQLAWRAVEALWEGIRWLHLVAMAFFVGGQLLLAVAVVPVLRGEGDRDRIRGIARRFGWGTLVAIGVLLATGAAMASHFGVWGSSTLHVKLALVGVVAALVVWHMRRPTLHALEGAIFLVSLAIVWLGVAIAH
jgi:hypothetical protein